MRVVRHADQDAGRRVGSADRARQLRTCRASVPRRCQHFWCARRAAPTPSSPRPPPTRNRSTRPAPPAASPPTGAPKSSSTSSATSATSSCQRSVPDVEGDGTHGRFRIPPPQAPAALRLRGSERHEGARPRRRPGHRSISAWAIPTCRRRRTSSPSWPRPPATRAPTAIPPRAASRACARRRPPTTPAASASTLDPESEIIVTLGSKEGLANLAQAITSPGDTVLVPNPSYPIHPYGFIIAGGSVRHIPVPGTTSLEEIPAGARARRAARGAEAAGAGAELSRRTRRRRSSISISTAPSSSSAKRQGIWILSRSRLCRDLFRRRAAALGAAGAGRARHRRSSSPR